MLMSKAAVDYCADANKARLHKLSRLMAIPSFVDKGPSFAPEDIATLPLDVFADTANRKFPLHTKAATWLAQAYFSHDRHLYPTPDAAAVQGKIEKAAQYWGIEDFTKQARSEVETFQSSVAPDLQDGDFALIIEKDGTKSPMLPINNETNIKASAATLFNMRGKTPYEWRLLGARRILHKAAALGVEFEADLGSYLTKAAGFGSVFPERAADHLAHRTLMIPDSQKEVKIAAAKLTKAISVMPGLPSNSQLIKLATIVDRMDREQGFTKYYDEAGLETPEEIFFELTQEKAASIRSSYMTLTTGEVIPFEALQSAPLAKIAGALGFLERVQATDSLDVNITKFAKIASTLPRDDAATLSRLLRAANVKFEDPTAANVM